MAHFLAHPRPSCQETTPDPFISSSLDPVACQVIRVCQIAQGGCPLLVDQTCQLGRHVVEVFDLVSFKVESPKALAEILSMERS